MNPTVFTRASHYALRETVLSKKCHILATVHEDVNTKTGEETVTISIDDIIELLGQAIAPRAIPLDEFRSLCATVRSHHNNKTKT